MRLRLERFDFAKGQILLVTDGESLCALDFLGYEDRLMKGLQKRYGAIAWCESGTFGQEFLRGVSDRLQSYFAGNFNSLDEIPVNPGGTPFQQTVWLALRTIPAGTTLSYGELAQRIGKPSACRAVGMTNGLNPIALVLPCHRVIGSNGSLTGYAGGLETKRWLLQHEGVELGRSPAKQQSRAQPKEMSQLSFTLD